MPLFLYTAVAARMTAESAGVEVGSYPPVMFTSISENMTGGYDPTSTPADSAVIRAATAVYKNNGIDPVILPRLAGSWPGYVFTGEPLRLPAGHFGLGHGSGAHAPDEYYVIESANPKIQGMDGAVLSFVEYLFELATVS